MRNLVLFLFLLIPIQLTIAAEPRMFSTGVGIDQRQNAHEDYNVKLVFFVTSSAYLANINVEIVDENRRLLVNTNSYGPWLFLNLPQGRYYVIASRQNGDTQSGYLRINSSQQQEVALMFPNRD